MVDNIKKCGYLIKQGAVVKNWKRRWFSLTGQYVRYYEKQEDEGRRKPKGTIVIREECQLLPMDDKKRFCFELRHPSERCYWFVGGSDEDRAAWIKVMQDVIDNIVRTSPTSGTASSKDPVSRDGQWATYVAGLRSDSAATQMETLQNLFQLLEAEVAGSGDARTAFVNKGGVEALIALMQNERNDNDVRAASAQVLGLVGQEDTVRLTIVQNGGIDAAKTLLESQEVKLQKYGCFVLVCVTQHPISGDRGCSHDCCLYIEKSHTLESLVTLIKASTDEKTRSWGTSCVGNCAYIEDLRPPIVTHVGFDLMNDLLHSEHWETQANAAHLIGNIAINTDTREALSTQPGLIKQLVTLLSSEKPILQRFILRAISNLGLHPAGQEGIMRDDGVQQISAIISNASTRDPQVVASACMAVVNMSPNQAINRRFVELSLKALLALVVSDNPGLQLYALRALFNLDRFCDDNRETFIEAGIVDTLSPLLQSHSEDLQLVADAFLQKIAKQETSKKQYKESSGTGPIERHFQDSGSSDTTATGDTSDA